MKKIILFVLSLITSQSIADTLGFGVYATFPELVTSASNFDEKEVVVYGFLKKVDGVVYLCDSMEVCFTKNKMRLKVDTTESINIDDRLNCHVELFGNFKAVPKNFRYLDRKVVGSVIVSISPSLSISEGYLQINTLCAIYNVFADTHGDIGVRG